MTQHNAASAASILARTAILAVVWWLIAQGQVDAWLIGLPAVALAAAARSIGRINTLLVQVQQSFGASDAPHRAPIGVNLHLKLTRDLHRTLTRPPGRIMA
jgi:hypothetical protein